MWTPVRPRQRQARRLCRPAGPWARERGRRKVGHSGGPALADVAVYPDQDLAVVVLTNQRKLFPNLAQGVARLYLPATGFVGAPAIADKSPELTARLTAVITDFAKGKARAEEFVPSLRADLPEIAEWMQLGVGGLPAMTALELVGKESRKRTYRARHGDDRTLLWDFLLDAKGLIEDVGIRDE